VALSVNALHWGGAKTGGECGLAVLIHAPHHGQREQKENDPFPRPTAQSTQFTVIHYDLSL
jgi:hypothetical protein